ncbi:peptidyl-prolyl cis-trans isomerase [Zunongwangia sp.]|uniref:peptidyl-prolyl cis-trans isomerase n=1 Tax=Zunongwangia sp. TaxID=1965325 RepID=UPI003AA92467
MRILKICLVFLFVISFASCNWIKSFSKEQTKTPVVRVNNNYLYKSDIEKLLNHNTNSEDSAVIVNNYINRWAKQRLLMDRANLNLPETKQEEFDKLVDDYRNELYTNAYTEALVSKKLDSSFTDSIITSYYSENKDNFRLSQDLLKLRYVNLDAKNTNLNEIKKWFLRFDERSQEKLLDNALQFRNYSFNDSVWIKASTVYKKIALLSVNDRNDLLKKEHFLELKDSIQVYYIYIKDFLKKNETAPLFYAKPTVEQILLNKRKLELVKQLEKDITKDAIKNNQFEIYN